MEGHAAVPDLDGADRLCQNRAEIVEQDIADAAAENDAGRSPDEEIVEMGWRDRRGVAAP